MSAFLRVSALLVAGLFGYAVAGPTSGVAMDTNTPSPPTQPQSGSDKKPASSKQKRAPKKEKKKSEQEFYDGYKAAHAMIYQHNDFAGGIAKLRSLDQDDHADVANLLGFASRKLGRYDDARYWYEKALAANPNHTLTWSYYGMWHAEQGNLLKARDHLIKVASICGGTECREYVILKEVIEGTRAY
jgi:tetratricopeptide (TPR) repeat protein